ncbi:MAG: hypothetical protein IT377_34685 [Polyangiaceae bacterium]|nr:hypothetical protein [Polyangiaceae bacterium]
MRRLFGAGLAGLLATSVAPACSAPCETADSDPVRFEGGALTADGATYSTSPWDGPYLHFPAGRRFQIEHQLGVTPPVVLTYVAFDEHPFAGSNASESAGNQTVIERVDDEIVQVRNDTCSEFWLRVVAKK